MARFVNVDDFKKEIMECNADPINEFDLGWDTWGIFNAIDRVPAADVAPIIHAHWIEEDDGWDNSYWTCSSCGEPWWLVEGTPEDNNMFFCPMCGAKMDEEVK